MEAMHTGLWHQINHLSTLASWSFLLSRGDVSPGISLGNFSWEFLLACTQVLQSACDDDGIPRQIALYDGKDLKGNHCGDVS